MNIIGAVHLAQNTSDFLFFNYINDMRGQMNWTAMENFLDHCVIPKGITTISEKDMICIVIEFVSEQEAFIAGVSSVIDNEIYCFLPEENYKLKDYLEEMTISELKEDDEYNE